MNACDVSQMVTMVVHMITNLLRFSVEEEERVLSDCELGTVTSGVANLNSTNNMDEFSVMEFITDCWHADNTYCDPMIDY